MIKNASIVNYEKLLFKLAQLYNNLTMKKSAKDLIPKSKIPIAYLLDYIKEGLTISDFLSSYPWLRRKDVEKAIDEIKKREFTSQYAF